MLKLNGLVGWLISWFVHSLVCWLVGLLVRSVVCPLVRILFILESPISPHWIEGSSFWGPWTLKQWGWQTRGVGEKNKRGIYNKNKVDHKRRRKGLQKKEKGLKQRRWDDDDDDEQERRKRKLQKTVDKKSFAVFFFSALTHTHIRFSRR